LYYDQIREIYRRHTAIELDFNQETE